MFGLGKKAKKLDSHDMLIIKTEEGKRHFYQVTFPSVVGNDIVSMLEKLQKSKYNKPEFLGEIGGFHIITYIEGLMSVEVKDENDLEAHPLQIQDFANVLLRRLEALEESGKLDESDDTAFFMGELTMLRDGSFVPQQ
ncbi:hypothetical protein EDM56_18050 [Brevibacillus fluminis]|uniref:Uncharacterized protein n=1 Tax=Brevibacillus fluminis TaxID=511487 RepID=A0A3M8DD22_9BACL|nr:hypothetical protein [Brevibacillus fluminis]RNB85903.1 hypothetical protein EDM56_18050 [Brevibacillus fluminis]